MPRKNHNWILKEQKFTEEEKYEIDQALSHRHQWLGQLAEQTKDEELKKELHKDMDRCWLVIHKLNWEEIVRGRRSKHID